MQQPFAREAFESDQKRPCTARTGAATNRSLSTPARGFAVSARLGDRAELTNSLRNSANLVFTRDDPIRFIEVIAPRHRKRDHRRMGQIVHESLAAHLRSMSIDNFSISGDVVRIGRTHWAASVCRCGDPECDGWSLEPLVIAGLAIDAARKTTRDVH